MKNVQMEKTELEKILYSYNLTSPMDSDIKNYVNSSLGKQFKKILKKTGNYGFFTWITSFLYFFLKKNGILLSILKLFFSGILISSFTYGAYLAYDHCFPTVDEMKNTPNETRINESSLKNKNIMSSFHYSEKLSLKVYPFDEKNISENLSDEVLNIFQKELKFNKKATSKKKLLKVNYLLTGSLMTLNNKIVLFIKVININSSEIVYTSSSKIESRLELLRISKKVASEIPQYLENNP